MLFDSMICLRCGDCAFRLIGDVPRGEWLPAHGELRCDACGARYPIRDHILDMAPRSAQRALTLAGFSNQLLLAPQIYERYWRPRSLSLMTDGASSLREELTLLTSWLPLAPRQLVLDLGASTGLYARTLAQHTRAWGDDAPLVVAVDMSLGMLRAARHFALRAGLRTIVYLRAAVERLPFGAARVDALVCGGSFNEFRSARRALREARRVAKPSAPLFATTLSRASSLRGKLAQDFMRLSGLRFPPLGAFNGVAYEEGWALAQQAYRGVVAFSLMVRRPHAARQQISPAPSADSAPALESASRQ